MNKNKRLLVLNNYPIDRVMREVELGETPQHVVFGVSSLIAAGYRITLIPYPAVGLWSMIQQILITLRIPLELGDLQQQLIALSQAKSADLVYAPCGSQTHLLQYLRALGLFNLPVITLMHHPFPKGRMDFFRSWQRKLFVSGADVLATLSHGVAEQIKTYGARDSQLVTLQWGTDVEFYGEYQPPGRGVIATGRTGRDFKTFAKGLAASKSSGTIIGLKGCFTDPVFTSPNLRLIQTRNEQPAPGEDKGWMKYPELCTQMRLHSAIAIPLFDQNCLAGLTSVMDALGLGRAILLTRNKYIDIDIESEGIGLWVDPGDVKGWTEKLNWVEENPEQVNQMGKRAFHLAKVKYNSSFFNTQLAAILSSFGR